MLKSSRISLHLDTRNCEIFFFVSLIKTHIHFTCSASYAVEGKQHVVIVVVVIGGGTEVLLVFSLFPKKKKSSDSVHLTGHL